MLKRYEFYLLVSLIAHAALFYFFFKETPQPEPKPQQQQENKVEVKLKEVDFMPDSTYGLIACPNSYVGVGFKYRLITGEITDISPGSPAEKTGLRVGDEIVNMTNSDATITGEDFSITVLRNGEKKTFTMKTDDICTQP